MFASHLWESASSKQHLQQQAHPRFVSSRPFASDGRKREITNESTHPPTRLPNERQKPSREDGRTEANRRLGCRWERGGQRCRRPRRLSKSPTDDSPRHLVSASDKSTYLMDCLVGAGLHGRSTYGPTDFNGIFIRDHTNDTAASNAISCSNRRLLLLLLPSIPILLLVDYVDSPISLSSSLPLVHFHSFAPFSVSLHASLRPVVYHYLCFV